MLAYRMELHVKNSCSKTGLMCPNQARPAPMLMTGGLQNSTKDFCLFLLQ